jgi:hypothetical protein
MENGVVFSPIEFAFPSGLTRSTVSISPEYLFPRVRGTAIKWCSRGRFLESVELRPPVTLCPCPSVTWAAADLGPWIMVTAGGRAG